ncbi:MAG TPA: dihydrodipicolinate synthase family protein [Gemmatimonadales bacterium]
MIPAHPLALTEDRKLDERRQRALTRYYVAAGAGGIAVGVHSTEFAIHEPAVGLLEPVLTLAAEEVDAWEAGGGHPIVRVAGVVGDTRRAVAEADLARRLGFHVALVSFAGLGEKNQEALVRHVAAVGSVLPVMAFYLQPAVGGRELPFEFWRALVDVETLIAVKVAPFDRYRTGEVVRAVAQSARADEVALYTGNDDHIVGDLLTPYPSAPNQPAVHFVGGLLGQWGVWTRRAVELHARCRRAVTSGDGNAHELLRLGTQLTDANGAIFDRANDFAGCLPGIHEVLRRQGLLAGRWCLDAGVDLSPGQSEEIDRVRAAYPHLADDEFVREHVDDWMK